MDYLGIYNDFVFMQSLILEHDRWHLPKIYLMLSIYYLLIYNLTSPMLPYAFANYEKIKIIIFVFPYITR